MRGNGAAGFLQGPAENNSAGLFLSTENILCKDLCFSPMRNEHYADRDSIIAKQEVSPKSPGQLVFGGIIKSDTE